MHFKANPWDFDKTHNSIIDSRRPGLYLFHSYDPYLDVYFTKILRTKFLGNPIESKLKTIMGEEITLDWLQDNFESPGLFNENDSYIVLMAENINKSVFSRILEISDRVVENYLILDFSKECNFLDEAAKINHVNVLSITSPKFWETEKLFDFICKILRVNIQYDVRKYLLDNASMDTSYLISKLSMLKKIYSDISKVTVENIRELIDSNDLDLFTLAKTFSRKDQQAFMYEMVHGNWELEEISNLCMFMIRHLIKLIDVSEIEKKSLGGKISKYNKEIVTCSKLWTKDELLSELRKFSHWHLMARSNNPMLNDVLRNEYLNLINS